MSICKDYYGGNWPLFFYRIPWTIALRSVIDAAWYDDSKSGEKGDEIDCDNMTDDDIEMINAMANSK